MEGDARGMCPGGAMRDARGHVRALFYCVPLGRVAGVPVRAHVSWFIWPIGILLAMARSEGGWSGLGLGIAVLLIVVASLLCHEFAHVLAARHCGIGTAQVL